MGAYGTKWVKTPAFDQICQRRALFMNAYTPNVLLPALCFNRLNSWQLEEAANHTPYFPVKFTTYAETLAQNDTR